jgi:hypothetical protein
MGSQRSKSRGQLVEAFPSGEFRDKAMLDLTHDSDGTAARFRQGDSAGLAGN